MQQLCACGCGLPAFSYGRYPRRYKVGHNPNKKWASGDEHPRWKGGSSITKRGYTIVKSPHHPRANSNGYVRRSLLVVESTLGRFLLPDEIVHHINGDKQDDRPDNLSVMTQNEHARLHHATVTEEDVREIRACYGYETSGEIAQRFGIAPCTVSHIQTRRTWKHVPSEEPAC